jgi:S-adenosylmethionine uptake transporter
MQSLWMVLGAFFFSCMGVCVKFASAHYGSFELVFYRGLVGMTVIGYLAHRQGVSLRTPLPLMHLWRSVAGTFSLFCWFFSLAYLPLPTAMTLNYMSSVWMAVLLLGGVLLARLLQRQNATLPWSLVAAVSIGFIGVVLMLRPSFAQNQALPALLGLLSGMTAALAYMQVNALARAGEPELRTVFYFALGSVVVGLLGSSVVGFSAWPADPWQALWLLPVGVLATLGQLCMTMAYGRGKPLVTASLQYSGIVFSSFFGVFLFNDVLSPLSWLGMALIVGSGLAATLLRQRQPTSASTPLTPPQSATPFAPPSPAEADLVSPPLSLEAKAL